MLDPWWKSLSDQNEKTLVLYRALQTQPSYIFLLFALLTCSPHSQGSSDEGQIVLLFSGNCYILSSPSPLFLFAFKPVLSQTLTNSAWFQWFLSTHFCWPGWLCFLLYYSARLYFRVRKAISIYPSLLLRCVLPLTCAEPTAHIRTATRP